MVVHLPSPRLPRDPTSRYSRWARPDNQQPHKLSKFPSDSKTPRMKRGVFGYRLSVLGYQCPWSVVRGLGSAFAPHRTRHDMQLLARSLTPLIPRIEDASSIPDAKRAAFAPL